MNLDASNNGTSAIKRKGYGESISEITQVSELGLDELAPVIPIPTVLTPEQTLAIKRTAKKLDLKIASGLLAIHLIAVPAFFPQFFTWSGFYIFLTLFVITGLGITLGFHRLLTHGSFETRRWLYYIITLGGTLAFQGGPLGWVSDHLTHHLHSDKPGDPHSPHDGVVHSHFLWLLFKRTPDRDPRKNTKHLYSDPVIRTIDRLFWVPQVVVTLGLFGIGYWIFGLNTAQSWVYWGIGMRTAAVYNVTWAVNSICHTRGYRNFETDDDSTNNAVVGILGFGEGFHNNHHADPKSARHGMKWYELDSTYLFIRILEILGLARKVVRPNHDRLTRKFGEKEWLKTPEKQ